MFGDKGKQTRATASRAIAAGSRLNGGFVRRFRRAWRSATFEAAAVPPRSNSRHVIVFKVG